MFKRLGLLTLVVVLVIPLSGINSIGAQGTKVLRTAYLPGDVILDPSLGTWVNEIQIVNEMFVGITTLNELTVDVESGLASDWTVSDDGLTYTFNLVQGIPWVRYDSGQGAVVQATDADGNVRTVTAQDVVYGINRTLDPATGSQYAATLAPWIVKAEWGGCATGGYGPG
jgi:ABC-type oligopeptide transport system substrate-binding subunit